MSQADNPVPKPGLSGLGQNFAADIKSGFLVFLIAMPLCLGIAKASGYPPIAGVFTAIIGGLLVPWISNSELTIKGPAAGLIVIVLGCIDGFGFTAGKDPHADHLAYQMALAVGVVAGVIQIALAIFRSGILSEFFPTAAVHGMLASIGVMIASKQIHAMIGNPTKEKEPLRVIEAIPGAIQHMRPEIAAIGFTCLGIMILWALLPKRLAILKRIPSQLLVVVTGITLGYWFRLDATALVSVPNDIRQGIAFPDFAGAFGSQHGHLVHALEYVLMFSLIGTLESLLSAKAVDLLDPFRRKTDYNRDLLGIGIANTLASCIGGLPMISEIVRSKANIDNGARSRFANMFHAMFLLVFVALLPQLISLIPNAALAAMLVFTGYRLASPHEFIHMYKVGREQLVIFIATIIGVLATDLLIGVAIGIGVKAAFHVWNGAPIRSLFTPNFEITEPDAQTTFIRVKNSAVFSTWIALRRKLLAVASDRSIVLDLSDTRLVDHTVMEKLHELEMDFEQKHRKLTIQGLESHRGLSNDPHSAMKRTAS
jgi:MFS superfamily sulfate permease-like transporter